MRRMSSLDSVVYVLTGLHHGCGNWHSMTSSPSHFGPVGLLTIAPHLTSFWDAQVIKLWSKRELAFTFLLI